MLNPNNFAILTVDDAKLLVKFIRGELSKPEVEMGFAYKRVAEAGLMNILTSLEKLIDISQKMEYFNPDEYERSPL